jgi:hypothetical protein
MNTRNKIADQERGRLRQEVRETRQSSISDQMRVIRKYAKRRGLKIESKYSDGETTD